MGVLTEKDNTFEYQQDDGETTAWFSHMEEKTVLAHKGDPLYKKIFYLLITLGAVYLVLVFSLVH